MSEQEISSSNPELKMKEKTISEKKRHRNIEAAVEQILISLGEDPAREGLLKTPNRVARMYDELTAGYHADPSEIINGAVFSVEYDQMVVVKDIEFYSLCEHHLLPFFGRAHVAYLPKDKVLGLSKIPRVVEMFARRLQVQERLTVQIADIIEKELNPWGVAVVLEATHMCMAMRGVKKANAKMTTSAMRGGFLKNPKTRAEFLNMIGK